jgi:outer membrane protein assembly factor BamB
MITSDPPKNVAHIKRNPVSSLPRPLRIALLLVAAALASCGGGGGSGSSQAPPKIYAQILTLNTEALASIQYETSAYIQVADKTTNAAITNAAVTVNGTPLSYSAADQAYEGTLSIAAGATVTVAVAVNGHSYTATAQNFSTFPSITSPVSGTTWSAQADHLVGWSGVVPDSTSQYAVGIESTSGTALAWPSTGAYALEPSSQNSVTVPSGSLPAGNYYILVGIVDPLSFSGAATGSGLLIGGFDLAKLSVIGPSGNAVLSSLAISPDPITVSVGSSLQLSAVATYSDGTTQDVTTQVSWSSSNTSALTVSSAGLVAGVAAGSANVTAQLGPQSGTASATAYQLNPSPLPPLSQAVAYQIDYAHSGAVTVGGSGPTFPPTAHWSITLSGSHISYPVIAGGLVYVLTDLAPSSSTNGATLYAINESTGSIAWGPTSMAGAAPAFSVAYDHGTLFVTGDYGVRTFDAATGAPGWFNDQLSSFPVSAPPTAVNGILYVNTGYGLVAMDEVMGSKLWRAAAGAAQGSPAVSSDGVFTSLGCDAYKYDPVSGTILWHFATGCTGGGGYTPVVASGSLYTRNIYDTSTGTAPGRRLDAATGVQKSTFAADVVPAFSSTVGFFLSSKTLTATSLSTGNTLWTFTGDGNLVSAPILIDSVVVTASSSGTVYALDAASGAVLWTGSTGATISAPDELNPRLLTGLSAGEGYLVVPAGNVLNAWKVTP